MSRASFMLTESLWAYVSAHTDPISDVDRRLIAETARLPNAEMQVSPEQGRFLGMLVRLSGASRVLEIGTFTGYSALWMARALPDDGLLVACDVNDEWASIGRKYWEEGGVARKIDLRLGPALETLRAMPPDDRFDLAFIDADKDGYSAYFDAVVPRLRVGGLLVADNVLRHGRIEHSESESAAAVREFNDKAVTDPRLETLLLPVFDGLTLAIRRS